MNAGNDHFFTGRRYDRDLELYYYRNRWYDPHAGRFLSRDPLGLWGDSLNFGNGMGYVGQSPWNYVDPLGLEGFCATTYDWFWNSGPQLGPGVLNHKDPRIVQMVKAEHAAAFAKTGENLETTAWVADGVIREVSGIDALASLAEAIEAMNDGNYSVAGMSTLAMIPGIPGGAISKVKGRVPINSKVVTSSEYLTNSLPLPRHLQQKYDIGGVRFADSGHPDFTPFLIHDINTGKPIQFDDIPFTKGRKSEAREANRRMGWDQTPTGFTWHHHEEGKLLQLVPTDVHDACKHTGGVAYLP